jgi:transcriptional regulator with XRE-family HTH domain
VYPKNLRTIRKWRGLSQTEVADRTGLTQGRVSAIELGASVGEGTARRLASALSCRIEDMKLPESPTITLRLDQLSSEQLRVLTASK